jgi:hypothetical protein
MKNEVLQIGFSQRVRLEWLDYTAGLVLAGKSPSEINTALQTYLQDKLSVGGSAVRGNREKVITILMRIWVLPPDALRGIRDEGLVLARELPLEQHLALHWGLAMAVYPFWGTVAETVGRLLRLQKDVGAAQVQRRLREQLGERETVARAARRVVRSMVDLGVLVEGQNKGFYNVASPRQIHDEVLSRWLATAFLAAKGGDWLPLETLYQPPAFFPFALIRVSAASFAGRTDVEVVRHGMDQELVRWQG